MSDRGRRGPSRHTPYRVSCVHPVSAAVNRKILENGIVTLSKKRRDLRCEAVPHEAAQLRFLWLRAAVDRMQESLEEDDRPEDERKCTTVGDFSTCTLV